jgi:hypothetical protein
MSADFKMVENQRASFVERRFQRKTEQLFEGVPKGHADLTFLTSLRLGGWHYRNGFFLNTAFCELLSETRRVGIFRAYSRGISEVARGWLTVCGNILDYTVTGPSGNWRLAAEPFLNEVHKTAADSVHPELRLNGRSMSIAVKLPEWIDDPTASAPSKTSARLTGTFGDRELHIQPTLRDEPILGTRNYGGNKIESIEEAWTLLLLSLRLRLFYV